MCKLPMYVNIEKLHEELKLDTVGNYFRKFAQSFYNKIPQVRNALLQQVNDLSIISTCTGKRPRKTATKRRRIDTSPPARFYKSAFPVPTGDSADFKKYLPSL